MLTEIWRREQPDLVVSVVPNFNRALFQSLQRLESIHTLRHDPDRPRRLSSALLVGEARPIMSFAEPSGRINKRSQLG